MKRVNASRQHTSGEHSHSALHAANELFHSCFVGQVSEENAVRAAATNGIQRRLVSPDQH
jgi:hypothetical protein